MDSRTANSAGIRDIRKYGDKMLNMDHTLHSFHCIFYLFFSHQD